MGYYHDEIDEGAPPPPPPRRPNPMEEFLRAEQEKRERPLPQGSTAFQVRRASRLLFRYFSCHLTAEVGLLSTQVDVLSAINVIPEPTAAKVGRFLDLQPSSAGRSIRRLELRGLVRREPGADRRTLDLFLTTAGRDVLAQAEARLHATPQKRMRTLLGPDGVTRIRRELTDLSNQVYNEIKEDRVRRRRAGARGSTR